MLASGSDSGCHNLPGKQAWRQARPGMSPLACTLAPHSPSSVIWSNSLSMDTKG